MFETLWNLSWIQALKGDHQAALALVEEALVLVRPLANADLLARVWDARALVCECLGDGGGARADYRASLRLNKPLGNFAGVATVEGHLGNLAISRRDLPAAQTHLKQALAIATELGDRSTASMCALNLALVAYLAGDSARARALFLESQSVNRRSGDQINVAFALFGLALTETDLGEAARAALLHGCAAERLKQLGHATQPLEAELRDADFVSLGPSSATNASKRRMRTGNTRRPKR